MRDEAEQYRLRVEGRRARGPLRLDEVSPRAKQRAEEAGRTVQSPVGAIIARAARTLGERERATAAWCRIAPPECAAAASPAGVEGRYHDTLVLHVSSATMLFELRRQQAALERQLARLVPGLHRLRLVVAGPGAGP